MGGVLWPQLVGDKGLAAVEAVVAREHVAHAAAQRNKLQPLPAKQLESQQDGGDQGVCGSAEHADQTDGTGKPGGQAQQGASHTAKGGTDEEAWDHLAAFEAYCQGQGGQEDLAQKIPGQRGSLLHGIGNDGHSGPVVPPDTEQIRERYHGCTARKSPEPGIRDPFGDPVFQGVKRPAEQPGHGGTGNAQQGGLKRGFQRQVRDGIEHKIGRGDPEEQGYAVSNEGRSECGHKGRSERQPHVLHHHGEEGGGQRGAEQSGKERCHPADGGGAADVIAQMQQFSHVPADAAAHLQGCTLTAGRTAAQVGEHRAQKDGGHQQRADRLAALHGADDVVGAHAFALCDLVECHDGKACQRQAEQQPALRGPQLGDVLHAQVERCADYAADQTRGHGQQQPLQGHPQGGFGLAVKIVQVAHRNS